MLTRRRFIQQAGLATAGTVVALGPARVARAADRPFSGTDNLLVDGFEVDEGEIWEFDPNVTTTVTVRSNVVVRGELRMKPASPGVVHTLRFEGVDEDAFVGGGMEVEPGDTGLWVMGRGRLDLQGSERSGWVRDDAPTGWRGADQVVTCPNRKGVTSFSQEDWSATGRPPPVQIRGGPVHTELLNLTRNVVIEGTPGGRSHVFIHTEGTNVAQKIQYVEFRHMGVSAKAGRYPLHFHHCGDTSRGSQVRGCVVHHSGHRAFVPHASHGITFDDCVAYDVVANPYWWDKRPRDHTGQRTFENDSDDTVWNRCVAALVKRADFETGFLAGFTLGGGRNNACTNSVAVGVLGKGEAAGYEWPSQSNGFPNVWRFDDNTAHNNENNGVFVWQNSGSDHINQRTTLYHNGADGILSGAYAHKYLWDDLTILGIEEEGIGLHANGGTPVFGDPEKADRPQTWRNVSIADAAVAIAVHRGRLGKGVPILMIDVEIANCDRIVEYASDDYEIPNAIDFIDPLVDGGPMLPEHIDLRGAAPGSLIRVRNRDGSTFTIDHENRVGDWDGNVAVRFRDISGSVFEQDILWIAERGITKGCNPPVNDLYCPDRFVTRGAMAAFLVRALHYTGADQDRFRDIEKSVFERDIEVLAGKGVTRGCNPPKNDRFCPEDSVTRGQMAAFLNRAFGYQRAAPPDRFVDISGSVFREDILRLALRGVTRGCNPPVNDRFCPDEAVTRGQMAAFLHRALTDAGID